MVHLIGRALRHHVSLAGGVLWNSRQCPMSLRVNLGDIYYLYKYAQFSTPWGFLLVLVFVLFLLLKQNNAEAAVRCMIQTCMLISAWHQSDDSISESYTFPISIQQHCCACAH